MTATERLDAIDARAAAATEGPWVARRHGDHQYVSAARTSVAEVGSLFDDGGDGEVLADAEFIAHARQDIPDLSAFVRAVVARHHEVTMRSGAVECSCGRDRFCPDLAITARWGDA